MEFKYSSEDDVVWVEVPKNLKKGGRPGQEFVHCIEEEFANYDVKNIRIVFVIVQKEKDKALIKQYLDKIGIVSQFITQFTLKKKLTGQRPAMGVYTNILR
jgi:predicted Ser/Thr protein kinase